MFFLFIFNFSLDSLRVAAHSVFQNSLSLIAGCSERRKNQTEPLLSEDIEAMVRVRYGCTVLRGEPELIVWFLRDFFNFLILFFNLFFFLIIFLILSIFFYFLIFCIKHSISKNNPFGD